MRDPKGPVKPYRSPEEVAKRHKVPLEKIIKQVRMGTKVEGEHTTSKTGARITALQHVDELPDYYTRLKRAEKNESVILQLIDEGKKKKKSKKRGNLHQWFSGSKDKSGKPGWVNVVTGDSCASDKPGEGVPKCVSSSKRASMTPAERRSAAARKRAADPGQQEKSGAAKPTYVSTDKKKKMKEEFMSEEDKKGKGSGEKDACYHKVKARFKVWPSAYGSGALVKCRKAGAANWGNKSEEVSVEQQYEKDTKYCLLCRKNETRAECSYGPTMWDKYSIAKIHPANESKIHEDHKEIASGKKKDEEGYMANVEFDQIERAVNILRKKITKGNQQIPAWVQSKITRAADFIDTAADYISSDETVSEEQRPFPFKKVAAQQEKARKASVYGKDTGNEPSPQVSDAQKKATKRFSRMHQVSSAARRAQQEKQKAGRSSTFFKDTHPTSAPRMKKSRVNEELSEDLKQARKNVGASKCWPGKVAKGTKMKGGIEVPNCKPAEDTCMSFSQFMQLAEASPAWQRKEGKNPTGGLNAKGRASAKAQGHNLKPPVTTPPSELNPDSKAAKRRKSFCARMGGMPGPMKDEKGRPTRKALSLRKWNC